MLPTLSIDHLVFRVRDLPASATFYRAIFGEPVFQTEDMFLYQLETGTRLFFTKATGPAIPYDKEQPGLNHLAFGVESLPHLEQILGHLQSAGIPNSGIGIDSHGKQNYIWLNDPNGFASSSTAHPPRKRQ
jgi:catechol-2,3-dioxygenase